MKTPVATPDPEPEPVPASNILVLPLGATTLSGETYLQLITQSYTSISWTG